MRDGGHLTSVPRAFIHPSAQKGYSPKFTSRILDKIT
jgi:hypothetical protein